MDCIKCHDGKIRTLYDVCSDPPGGRITAESLKQWFVDIALALQDLHSQNIIHRDVKPGNILIDGDGHARLLDLGIAKVVDEQLSDGLLWNESSPDWLAKVPAGTLGFAAPELTVDKGVEITPAVDVYSLGATFFWLLTDNEPQISAGCEESLCYEDDCWKSTLPGMLKPRACDRISLEDCLSRFSLQDNTSRSYAMQSPCRPVEQAQRFERGGLHPEYDSEFVLFGTVKSWIASHVIFSALAGLAFLGVAVLCLLMLFDRRSPNDYDVVRRYEQGLEFAQRKWLVGANGNKARKWILSAANDGYIPAQREMGFLFKSGSLGATPDPKKAFEWFKRAADGGDAISQWEMAVLCMNGFAGMPPSDEAALPYLMMAASNGVDSACGLLGVFYDLGRGGLCTNSVLASEWYVGAASKGDICAVLNLYANFIENPDTCRSDAQTVLGFLQTAARNGSAYAAAEVGEMYATGDAMFGVKIDEPYAVEWFLDAIRADDSLPEAADGKDKAHFYLGCYYLDGRGGLKKDIAAAKRELRGSRSPSAKKILADILVREGTASSRRQAFDLYAKAGEEGVRSAKCEQARLLAFGSGVLPIDKAEAYGLFHDAAGVDCPNAITMCGVMEQFGEGGAPTNPTNAVKKYEQATQLGDPDGMYWLANAYRTGIGGLVKDDRKAYELYRSAAKLRHPDAACKVAEFHENGYGAAEHSSQTARSWWRYAAEELESDFAKARYGYYLHYGVAGEKDTTNSVRLAKESMTAGNAHGMYILACMMERDGRSYVDETPIDLHIKAAGLGDLEANFSLGCYYMRLAINSESNRYENATKAYRYLRVMADQGPQGHPYVVNSQGRVGGLLMEDWGDYPADYAKGLKMLRTAASVGDLWASAEYGYMLLYGKNGLPKDEKTAVGFLKKSSEGRYPAGDYLYALALLDGKGGVKSNSAKAMHIMERAAKNGFLPAVQYLKGNK